MTKTRDFQRADFPSRQFAGGRTRDNSKLIERAGRKLLRCRAAGAYRRDDLDQCPATVETTLRRLELLLSRTEFKNERVLLLGDDDLLSVAIKTTAIQTFVTVIDLDADLLLRIAEWTNSAGLLLLHGDLQAGLDEELAESFDIVFADPPYTMSGQLSFLKAGITALRNRRDASLFICASRVYLNAGQTNSIIQAATTAGLELRETFEDFNEYPAPPDVAQDIKRRGNSDDASRFYSSLFHFSPRLVPLNADLVPTPSGGIYEYED